MSPLIFFNVFFTTDCTDLYGFKYGVDIWVYSNRTSG